METTKIGSFFKHLSWRMGKENDLSNITYSLCKSNRDFMKFFLKFCFDEELDTYSLHREYSSGDSRPDFYFKSLQGNEYLIEIKRWDRNDHFEQYENTFPNAKRAFIANYAVPPRNNWKVKTWKGFFDELLVSPLKNDTIILGYLTYLKNLAHIKEFKHMKLDNYTSLPKLLNNLEEIIEQEVGCCIYNRTSFTQDWYGKFFEKKFENHQQFLWFYAGIWLHENTNGIYIGFYDDDNWISNQFISKLREMKDKYQTEHFEFGIDHNSGEYGTYFFKMKKIDVLRDDSKTKEQRATLREFIVEVFKVIGIDF